jgi:hypothetical protein
VRDLAAHEPTDDNGDCMTCKTPDVGTDAPLNHAESCPWRRAVEYSKAT